MSTSQNHLSPSYRSALKESLTAAERGAFFSPDRVHRYVLWRRWKKQGALCLFVGLNPSTADEEIDDPTIRRCSNFAAGFGAAGLIVANLFSFRATKPVDLFRAREPVGPQTDAWLLAAVGAARQTIACWGVHGSFRERSKHVAPLLGTPFCFGTTKSGEPRHPLYLHKTTEVIPLPIKR